MLTPQRPGEKSESDNLDEQYEKSDSDSLDEQSSEDELSLWSDCVELGSEKELVEVSEGPWRSKKGMMLNESEKRAYEKDKRERKESQRKEKGHVDLGHKLHFHVTRVVDPNSEVPSMAIAKMSVRKTPFGLPAFEKSKAGATHEVNKSMDKASTSNPSHKEHKPHPRMPGNSAWR